jgi:hypothetical protein
MSARWATRMSLHYLTAALVAGLTLSLAPTTPVHADEWGYRAPRVRTYAPVRPYAPVRTVVRTRVVYVPQPVYAGCGGCGSVPVAYRPAFYAPAYYGPRFYNYYGLGCTYCASPVAAPYYWAVRYARYRAYGYY